MASDKSGERDEDGGEQLSRCIPPTLSHRQNCSQRSQPPRPMNWEQNAGDDHVEDEKEGKGILHASRKVKQQC